MTAARVRLWGTVIGAVSLERGAVHAAFQYTPEFARSGIQVSPLEMPLSDRVFRFPSLPVPTFHGLPGLLADTLPDRYGNALIDAWLARRGRSPESFDAVERLCYTGTRGMGALELEPASGPDPHGQPLDVAALVRLASDVLGARGAFRTTLTDDDSDGLQAILQVGTSAGGARAKAVIAWNPSTGEVRSGQVEPGSGFEHWLLKFDGVTGSGDHGLADPQGFGVLELAYAHMARAAGITMTDCRLLEEGGRRHFMTRRFDRIGGDKLHMQSLGALAHLDYNAPGAHGYEQALQVAVRLGLSRPELEELFRRMVFNVVARNQDDHVKNLAFLMDRRGRWSLAPAFDLTYAHNPSGLWTARHQMTVNGKQDGFTHRDLHATAASASIKRHRAEALFEQVHAAVSQWPRFAAEAGVAPDVVESVRAAHRLELPRA